MGLGDEERPEDEQVHHVLSPSVQHKPLHVSGGSVNSGLGVHSPIYFNLTATLCITIVFGGENGVHSRGADWNTHLPPQASTLSTCRELSSRAAGLARPVCHPGSRWSWTEQEPPGSPLPGPGLQAVPASAPKDTCAPGICPEADVAHSFP